MHVADGIQFVRDIANSGVTKFHGKCDSCSNTESSSNGSSIASHAEDVEATKVDIVIVDVDSSDSR